MSATHATTPVLVERLDVDNYATWRSRIKFLLISKGLWGAVSGESIDPETDKKALAQIGLYVMEHHLSTLERCGSAKEAWDTLEATFQAKSNARKRQLRKELTQLEMGATEPLTKYVARAKEIQNQLRATGYEIKDQEVAWSILAGLPASYDTVVTVLETSTDADLTLDDMLPKLMAAEQKMHQHTECRRIPDNAAYSAQRNGNRGFNQHKDTRTCYNCGERGHIARDCPKRRNGGRPNYHGAIAL